MYSYIARRLAFGALTVVGVSIMVFVIMRVLPGDPLVALFGPEGFTTETLEIDIREGGRWRFVYTSPDGTRYDNRMVFLRMDAPRLLEIEHGSDVDDDPTRFHVTITFDEQSDGKCVLTMRQLHPTKEQRDAGIGFGAVEYGYQTIGKLARHLGVS